MVRLISIVVLAVVGSLVLWLTFLAFVRGNSNNPRRQLPDPRCVSPRTVLRDCVTNLRFRAPTNLRTMAGIRVIEPFGFSPASHSRHTLLAAAAPMRLLAAHNTLIPLEMDEGVYWVTMHFPDGQRARAVVDTGSSNLVIGSQLCRRCPLHKNGVVMHPDTERIHARDVHIAYGSQRVVTDVTMHTMNIQGLELDSDLSRSLLHNADAVVAKVEGGTTPRLDAINVHTEVLMMKRVEGSTAANVFGIAPSPMHVRRPSLLSLLLPHAPRFGLMLGTRGGAMTLGPPPATAGSTMRIVHVPMQRPPHLQRAPTLFFMTRLLDVLVGPSLSAMRSMFALAPAKPPPPLWAMFDSGSTATFTSTALRAPWRAAQQAAGTHTPFVSLVLPNRVHVVLAPSAYVWDGNSTLDTSTTFVNDLLKVEGVLVGCMATRGVFMDHDVANGQLGFAAMHHDFLAE